MQEHRKSGEPATAARERGPATSGEKSRTAERDIELAGRGIHESKDAIRVTPTLRGLVLKTLFAVAGGVATSVLIYLALTWLELNRDHVEIFLKHWSF